MFDVKIFDPNRHKQWTGVSNERILANLKLADTLNVPFIVRTPIVVDINDTVKEIDAIVKYIAKLKNLKSYELLPYHSLGLSKHLLNKPPQKEFKKPSKERIDELAYTAVKYHLPVKVASIAFAKKESIC
jgi:pyruvate formate lyase activating enzyme